MCQVSEGPGSLNPSLQICLEVPLDEQQNELSSQSSSELVLRGENQEVAQQVHDQDYQPLSTVAMEAICWGGWIFYNSRCVATFKESHSRAGERKRGRKQSNRQWRKAEQDHA